MGLSYRKNKFFPRTPPFCEHSSIGYNVQDLTSLPLNHSDYSHIEVCSDPVQHLMGNPSNLRSNIILESINNLGIVSIDPVF